jgi:hypothetical protein
MTIDEYENLHSLPQLSGTPKQISWARSIRYTLLNSATPLWNSIGEKDKASLLSFLKMIKHRSSSRYWIDNKDSRIRDMWKSWGYAGDQSQRRKRRGNNWEYVGTNTDYSPPTYLPPKVIPKRSNWKVAISKQARAAGLV